MPCFPVVVFHTMFMSRRRLPDTELKPQFFLCERRVEKKGEHPPVSLSTLDGFPGPQKDVCGDVSRLCLSSNVAFYFVWIQMYSNKHSSPIFGLFLNCMACSSCESKQARRLRKSEERKKNPEKSSKKSTIFSFQVQQRWSEQTSF